MDVMTFNLRFDNKNDGANAWPLRRELVKQLVEKYNPHVLGTQEGLWSQLAYLKDNLSAYHIHTPNREFDPTCQYPTLFFHKEKFEVLEGGEFWLSLTPMVHRSKNWDSAFPRMMSYAKIRMDGKGEPVWVSVTHLDHIGTEARYQQAKIIADWIKQRTAPIILMGDFNDSPGSPVHRVLSSPETGLKDTWSVLGCTEETPDSMTHHGFTGVPQKARMDWIMISPHFKVKKTDIIKDNRDGRYPSDHFPYMAKLDWD